MDNQNIAIFTDSTCDIPPDLVDKYQIQVLPHTVIWGEEQFLDREELSPLAFYQRLETDPRIPTTAHVSEHDFATAFKQVQSMGVKEIVVLTVSAAMSGAYRSAMQAARNFDLSIHVVDSKGPTMSLGWQVLAAARAREAGENIQGILKKVDQVRDRLVQLVALDTLKYLQIGGRIGDAAKLIGTALQIKPLVQINHQSGKVETAGVARTHKKLVNMLYEKFFSKLEKKTKLHIAVLHGNIQEEAEQLAARIMEEFHPDEMIINLTGPVLGINTGPGAIALCGYYED